MDANDPRHGTHRGYVLGCRLPCCTVAQMHYMKLYRMGRKPRLISPVGTVRRIRALQAIGWSYAQIGAAVGKGENWAYMIPRSPSVTSTTAALVARAYDKLSMVVPDSPYAVRNRKLARRNNWPPPLAWDDIDDPDQQPQGLATKKPRNTADPVVVHRILGGEWRLPANVHERRQVIAQWAGDLNELERLTGWNVWRLRGKKEAA